VQRLADADQEERVAALDRRTRWMLPVAAALILGGCTLLLWL
jgi:hypothetical protein